MYDSIVFSIIQRMSNSFDLNFIKKLNLGNYYQKLYFVQYFFVIISLCDIIDYNYVSDLVKGQIISLENGLCF